MNNFVLRRIITVGIALFLPGPSSAFAQAPYVSASAGMDVSRFSGADLDGGLRPGGEALAVSLRAGTLIGERWGLEVGFTRPSEVESESRFRFPIALPVDLIRTLAPGLAPIAPIFQSSTRLQRRDSTIETAAWVRQSAGPVDLVYLGGIAFNRTVEEMTVNFGRIAILPGPSSIRTTTYGVAPLIGIEGRIGMTDHLRLVAGTRLQSIDGGSTGASGWIVRPSAGLMWQF